jgi:hypothetical protein
MLPLRVLAVANPPDPRLSAAVVMVAGALDANPPDCALPMRIRVHNGQGEARTSLVDNELWIDVLVPANADPLPMVALESTWEALRLAQSRHPEARIAYPVSRARALLQKIEQRMEAGDRNRDAQAHALRNAVRRQLEAGDPNHAIIVHFPLSAPQPPQTSAALTAVFEKTGPGMPAFRVTRRRRRAPDRD